MRFDLLLHGLTGSGKKCFADVSVYANSAKELQDEVHKAGENGPWHADDTGAALIEESETITVERVEMLREPESG